MFWGRFAATPKIRRVQIPVNMGDQVYRQRVNEHVEGGKRSGARGTPTFFVNGEIVDVSFGLDHLFKAVETSLRS